MDSLELSRDTFAHIGLFVTGTALPDTLCSPIAEIAAELRTAHPDLPRQALSGPHNPWGPSARVVDAWRLLDVCENPTLVDLVAGVLGPDLVLWDSELVVRPRDRGDSQAWQGMNPAWPIEPLAGATVRVAIDGSIVLRYRPGSHGDIVTGRESDGIVVAVPPGHAVVADVRLEWRYECEAPFAAEFVVRYMPATSRYNRDPLFPSNQAGTRTAPLVNYPLRPLWLVRGEDRAGNDFVTGFASPVPTWSPALW